MNGRNWLRRWATAVVVVAACAGWLGPQAAAAADYVQTVKERGVLRAGVKYDSPPYGWLNPATNKPEGFDIDVARIVAAHILGSADRIQFTQVTTANRIPLLQQGDIDVVLATMTITADRRKQIDFSIPYFPSGDGVLVAASSPLAKPEDLKGKTVCFTSGSASEQFLVEALKPLGFPIARKILLNTYPECVQAIKVGRADYLFTDFGTLQGLAKEIAGVKVLPFLMDTQDWGIGVSKAHPELLDVVNAAIKEAFASGRWLETYKKWQGGDPPAGWPPKK
jgi:aspartate/glutamate/glutamine transport system substrate-binding protein